MKRFYKIMGNWAGIFAGLGLILCIVGAVTGARGIIIFTKDKGFEIINNEEQYKYENMDLALFSNIKIDTHIATVRIKNSTDGKYGVKCNSWNKENPILVDVIDETLSIKDNESNIKFSIDILSIFGKSHKNEIIVYVPSDKMLDTVIINSKVGDVRFDEIFGANNVDVTADVGEIRIESGTYGRVELSANVGDIRANDTCVTDNLVVTSDVGDVKLSGKFESDINITSNVGDVILHTSISESEYNYKISSDVGDIEWFGAESHGTIKGNTSGKYNIYIKTNIGDIEVD